MNNNKHTKKLHLKKKIKAFSLTEMIIASSLCVVIVSVVTIMFGSVAYIQRYYVSKAKVNLGEQTIRALYTDSIFKSYENALVVQTKSGNTKTMDKESLVVPVAPSSKNFHILNGIIKRMMEDSLKSAAIFILGRHSLSKQSLRMESIDILSAYPNNPPYIDSSSVFIDVLNKIGINNGVFQKNPDKAFEYKGGKNVGFSIYFLGPSQEVRKKFNIPVISIYECDYIIDPKIYRSDDQNFHFFSSVRRFIGKRVTDNFEAFFLEPKHRGPLRSSDEKDNYQRGLESSFGGTFNKFNYTPLFVEFNRQVTVNNKSTNNLTFQQNFYNARRYPFFGFWLPDPTKANPFIKVGKDPILKAEEPRYIYSHLDAITSYFLILRNYPNIL